MHRPLVCAWEGVDRVTGRILAIDFGLKRMGLAVSDGLGITAQGLPTLERTRLADDLQYIQNLAEEYSLDRVIVGNPLAQSGKPSAMAGHAEQFASKLRQNLACPVDLWDERFTSAEANRLLRESGISIQKRHRATDRVAAVLLLQSYLDYQANEKERRAAEAGSC
jgi:putative holliday junction resolvase